MQVGAKDVAPPAWVHVKHAGVAIEWDDQGNKSTRQPKLVTEIHPLNLELVWAVDIGLIAQ
jgi:hypothetical protein